MTVNQAEIEDQLRQRLKIRISVSFWDGKIASDRGQESLAKTEHIKKDRAEVKIRALDSKVMSALTTVLGQLKNLLKRNSFPWEDGGWRLIYTDKYSIVRPQIDNLIREAKDVVRQIVKTKYDTLKKDYEIELNGLAKETPFPSPERLLERYDVRFFVQQVSMMDKAALVSSGIPPKEVERMMAEDRKDTEERIRTGNTQLLENALEKAKKLAESLTDPDCRYHGMSETGFPLIENVRSDLDLLEGQGFIDDKMAGIIARTRKVLDGIDLETARKDKTARKEAAKQASSLIDDLKSFA